MVFAPLILWSSTALLYKGRTGLLILLPYIWVLIGPSWAYCLRSLSSTILRIHREILPEAFDLYIFASVRVSNLLLVIPCETWLCTVFK